MLPDADAPLLHRFRARLAARIGLTFDDNRTSALAAVLAERASATHFTPEQYVDYLGSSDREVPELAKLLTVAETYFFRNAAQLEACMGGAIPACVERNGSGPLRILSAACASGEEPYSLAMLMRERCAAVAPRTTIVGTDVNPVMLQRARRARYSAWSLRETPAAYRERYFTRDGGDFVLDRPMRDAVTFEAMNLVEPEPTQLAESTFDIVFCRNALMYFTLDQFASTVERLRRALVPGGFLFLGHAETLRGITHGFHLCHSGEAFYYQKKCGRPSARAPVERFAQEPPALSPATALDPSWFDAIHHSADRIDALHGDALEQRQATPVADDEDHALLRAVVAAHDGHFDEARASCESILLRDELNAGAQYVLALCHEHAGNADRAIYHDQLSAYLDPGFAMPRVHLGLLYKRRGDGTAAGRELREARRLIEREDSARLLLFGGGFGRAALLALCDAELGPGKENAR
jgi:chemotaxis protein methyltransferase CheR